MTIDEKVEGEFVIVVDTLFVVVIVVLGPLVVVGVIVEDGMDEVEEKYETLLNDEICGEQRPSNVAVKKPPTNKLFVPFIARALT